MSVASIPAGGGDTVWRRFGVGWALLLLLIAIAYDAFFLRIFSQWWFEDDPVLFAFAKSAANPLAFFLPGTLKAYGAGGALAPLQGISEWIDGAFAYRSVTFAHWHNVASLTATLWLGFHVLRHFSVSRPGALFICVLWLFLPPTIVVNEFLAARHYLEGFAVSLLAVGIAQEIAQGRWTEDGLSIGKLYLTLATAMLFKEIFAITVPLFIFIYLYEAKRYRGAIGAVVLVPFYLLYRYLSFGAGVSWGSPFLGPMAYLRYLTHLPYAMAGNCGGYLLLIFFGLALVGFARKRGRPIRVFGYATLLIASNLVVIYPVSYPLSHEWMENGAWDRVLFPLDSGLLFAGGIFWFQAFNPQVRRLGGGLALIILLCGAVVTREKWQVMMAQYRREGLFYLAHPDRLLYSEVRAAFFLDGVRELYNIPKRHHVLSVNRTKPPTDIIAGHTTIWRLVDGKFRQDRKLFLELESHSPSP
ncbi:MAG TPA: hypothetical protein VGF73_12220 [Chthoniobacterales bacterium]